MGEYSSVVGWKRLYVYLGREKLVEHSQGTTWLLHADHLGGPRVGTGVNGTAAERWDHDSKGEPGGGKGEFEIGEFEGRIGGGDQPRLTGHPRDAESGDDYAGARYYSNIRGRWLIVDPMMGDLSNPQRLNRYGYVLNDPVNYLDPDGRGRSPSTPDSTS